MLIGRRYVLGWGLAAMAGSALAAGPAPRRLFEGELLADYHQIYLRDADHLNLPDDYSAEALRRRMSIGPHAIIIHPVRNMPVPVRVDWHDVRPAPVLAPYQLVVEASFASPSGQLVIAGLTDYEPDAARLSVPPGTLGVRVSMSGLDTLSEDGLDGNDRYLIQLWSGDGEVRLLKAWEEGSTAF